VPKSAAHLKEHRFAPGQSGNPGGCPKGLHTLEYALRKRMKEKPELMAKIVDALLDEAIAKRNPTAFKIIAERLGGVVGSNVLEASEALESADSAQMTVILNDEQPAPDVPGQ
jgi:hypothetical protein